MEWRHEKRRRLFFFEDGELVLVQSNLKSESPERLAVKYPSLSPEDLALQVLQVRVIEGITAAEGEVNWYAGTAAPTREPADIVALLWPVADQFPKLPADSFPRAVPAVAHRIARLPLLDTILTYLIELDGTRPLEDIVDFGPADPETLLDALAIAAELGAVDLHGAETTNATIVPGAAAKPAPPPPRTGATDIADLIREEIGAERSAPPDEAPATERRTPPVEAPATHIVRRPHSGTDQVTARFGAELSRIRAAADHFATLGVTPEDPPDTLRRTYFALARELHPDRFVGEPPEIQSVATELFDRVRAAWEVLADDARREAYIAKVIRGEMTEDEKAMEKVQVILSAENDFRRGMAEFNGGRLTVAHDLFHRASVALPEEPEFAAYAGYTTFKLHSSRDDAAADAGAAKIKAALEANEKLDGVWVLQGLVARARGKEDTARTAFVTALKLKPSNPDAARELRRLERDKETVPAPGAGGFFSRIFGKKPKI